MTPSVQKLKELIAAVQKHKELAASGAPFQCEAQWNAISMRAAEAEPGLVQVLAWLEAAEAWIAGADHNLNCTWHYPDGPCQCGLSELRAKYPADGEGV